LKTLQPASGAPDASANTLSGFLAQTHAALLRDQSGAVADYIPELLKGNPDHFGIALATTDGHVYESGDAGVPFTEVREGELEKISSLATPNQVLAVFKKPVFKAPDPGHSVSLVLDGIQDPGNLGTIVRIADWFGVGQVICTRDSADVFSPKATQSTMGSISRVQVLYEDPAGLMSLYPELPVYAAVLEGKSIFEQPRITKGWIVIGNESKGIRGELLQRSTHPITIPRIGEAESLNAAVAAGIILSHLVR